MNEEDSFAFTEEAMFSELELQRLLRRLHTLAWQTATECCGAPPKSAEGLLQLMRLVLAEERITLKHGEPLKDAVLIPRKETPSQQARKILDGGTESDIPHRRVVVGLAVKRERFEKDDSQVWQIVGVDATCSIRVLRRHLPTRAWEGHLCALCVQNEPGGMVTTRKVFETYLHPYRCAWLDKSYEYAVYDKMVRMGLQPEKPLKPMAELAEFGDYKPFVVRGFGLPIVIEVWGMAESNTEYRRHMKVKQDVYRMMEHGRVLRLLEWNVERDGESGLTELINKLRDLTRPAGT